MSPGIEPARVRACPLVNGVRLVTNRGPISDDEQPTVAAVDRAIDVLLHFAEKQAETFGVSEIASDLTMSKTTVHRILTSLRARGLVQLDPASRRYSLGPTAMQLGSRYLARVNVRRMAVPVLQDLSATMNETATLSVRTGDSRVYVDQVTPPREVFMSVSIGVPFPLHAGASSKAFLAFLPDAHIDTYLERNLQSLTEGTITEPRKLRAELRAIKSRGWAQSDSERQVGAASVAAPVLNHLDVPVAVISICGPSDRFRPEAEECAKMLVKATQRLSADLGHISAVPAS
jgi:IclR family transcriptional regulator, acetate operon repressor